MKDVRLDPYADWKSYIERQNVCSVATCQCRKAAQITGEVCEPDQAESAQTCLMFGEIAQYWIDNGQAREATPQECLEIVERGIRQQGLVPQLLYCRNPEILCLCNATWCQTLAFTTHSSPQQNATLFYTVEYNQDRCIGCGACEAVCPVKAIDVQNGLPLTNAACVACGHCVRACPKAARWLIRQESRPNMPADLLDADRWRTMERMEHGKVRDYPKQR